MCFCRRMRDTFDPEEVDYYLYLLREQHTRGVSRQFQGNIWNISGTNFGWGSMFWGFNEEPMQHAYEAANHGELQEATLRMNLRNYQNYKTLARQQWIGRETEAIFIEETRAWNGPEKVPDSISKDLLACTTPDGAGPMTPALESVSAGPPLSSFAVAIALRDGPV